MQRLFIIFSFLILYLLSESSLGLVHAGVIPINRIRIGPAYKHHLRMVHEHFRQRHARSSPTTLSLSVPQVGGGGNIPLVPTTITLLPQVSATTASPSSSSISSVSSASMTSSSQATSSTVVPTLSSSPSASAAPSSTTGSAPKYVFAHHMVGNTFPYTVQDWSNDITLAHASGIDGFALNMGVDSWQPARVGDAFDAALQSGLDFKLFLSLDMSSLPCASPQDAQNLRNLVLAHITHPNQFQYNNRAFVSTFSGESCTFSQGSAAQGWDTQFVNNPDLQGKIYFVPSFFIDPTQFVDFKDVMDGDFNWNSGWPTQVTTSFAQSLVQAQPQAPVINAKIALASGNTSTSSTAASSSLSTVEQALSQFIGSTTSDEQHLESLANMTSGKTTRAEDGGDTKKAYMAAVSPWFFTHYGQDSYNKNFVFLSDQHLYAKRWESLISTRDQVDMAEILTWNDYGESHYIGPIEGAQPNSQAWVNGMNHTGWLEVTQYYATAFKTGQFPPIEQDKLFMWSRTHPANAQAPDPVGQPSNFQLMEDAVWALVMATQPATVTLSTSNSTSQNFNVPAGVSKLSIPISAGGFMKGLISRNGQTVLELNPTQFSFDPNPQTYNFNAFVASAST